MPMQTDRITAAMGFSSRIFICALGITTIAWGCYAFPIFWRQSGFEKIADHVIAGDAFKADVLAALTPKLDAFQAGKWGHPSALRNLPVIRLRILENSITDSDKNTVDVQMAKLHKLIDVSLVNAPADPFLWLVLFWLENTQIGYSVDHVKYLRMSYSIGPNEGWIGVKRNRFALAIFSQLPPDLSEDAKGEFVRLVDSHFYNEAAATLTGPGWGIRNILLAELKQAAEFNRNQFARTLYKLGYDVLVPGVEQREPRPWN